MAVKKESVKKLQTLEDKLWDTAELLRARIQASRHESFKFNFVSVK